jgi:hypothetical protein
MEKSVLLLRILEVLGSETGKTDVIAVFRRGKENPLFGD